MWAGEAVRSLSVVFPPAPRTVYIPASIVLLLLPVLSLT